MVDFGDLDEQPARPQAPLDFGDLEGAPAPPTVESAPRRLFRSVVQPYTQALAGLLGGSKESPLPGGYRSGAAEAVGQTAAEMAVPQTPEAAAIMGAAGPVGRAIGPAAEGAGFFARALRPLARMGVMGAVGVGAAAATGGVPIGGAIQGAAAQGLGEVGGAVLGRFAAPAGPATPAELETIRAARAAGVDLPADASAPTKSMLQTARMVADWSLLNRNTDRAAAQLQRQVTNAMDTAIQKDIGDLAGLEGSKGGALVMDGLAQLRGSTEAARQQLFKVADQLSVQSGASLPTDRAKILFGDTASDLADRIMAGGRRIPGPLKATIAAGDPIPAQVMLDPQRAAYLQSLNAILGPIQAGVDIPVADLLALKAGLREAIPARVLLGKSGSPEDLALRGIYGGVRNAINEALAGTEAAVPWAKAMTHFHEQVLPVRAVFDEMIGTPDSQAISKLIDQPKETIEALMSRLPSIGRAQVRGAWFAQTMEEATPPPGARGAGMVDWGYVTKKYEKLGSEKQTALFGELTPYLDSVMGVARAASTYTGRLFGQGTGTGRMVGFQIARLAGMIASALGYKAGMVASGPAGAAFFGTPILLGKMLTTPSIARWMAGESALEQEAITATRSLLAATAGQVPNTPWGRQVLESLQGMVPPVKPLLFAPTAPGGTNQASPGP